MNQDPGQLRATARAKRLRAAGVSGKKPPGLAPAKAVGWKSASGRCQEPSASISASTRLSQRSRTTLSTDSASIIRPSKLKWAIKRAALRRQKSCDVDFLTVPSSVYGGRDANGFNDIAQISCRIPAWLHRLDLTGSTGGADLELVRAGRKCHRQAPFAERLLSPASIQALPPSIETATSLIPEPPSKAMPFSLILPGFNVAPSEIWMPTANQPAPRIYNDTVF